jgi:uncharacterized protein YecE (DUF72 family)
LLAYSGIIFYHYPVNAKEDMVHRLLRLLLQRMERKVLPIKLPQKDWFNYYTQHFNTLEINSSFYRFPRLANLKTWHSRSPEDFLFALKVPAAITHYKQFKETQRMLNDFYSVAKEGLNEKLGPVLFQLPPKLAYSNESSRQFWNR